MSQRGIGITGAVVENRQDTHTVERIGADRKLRATQQHAGGVPLLPGDAPQPIVEVGLVGVADVIDPLNANHGIQIAGADRDRTSGVVVDSESEWSYGLGDRVDSQ